MLWWIFREFICNQGLRIVFISVVYETFKYHWGDYINSRCIEEHKKTNMLFSTLYPTLNKDYFLLSYRYYFPCIQISIIINIHSHTKNSLLSLFVYHVTVIKVLIQFYALLADGSLYYFYITSKRASLWCTLDVMFCFLNPLNTWDFIHCWCYALEIKNQFQI